MKIQFHSSCVTSMSCVISNDCGQKLKMDTLIFQLSTQNETLIEKNLSLGDKVKELEQKQMGEQAKVEQKLLKELMACYSELQGLVQICIQRAEGQDPNISVLLGGKGMQFELSPF